MNRVHESFARRFRFLVSVAPFRQAILLAALVADFMTMFLITVVAGWRFSRSRCAWGRRSKARCGWRAFEGISHATTQIAVRGNLFLMLAFGAASAQLGTEVILGAFLAGVLLALFTKQESSDLHHKLEALALGFLSRFSS